MQGDALHYTTSNPTRNAREGRVEAPCIRLCSALSRLGQVQETTEHFYVTHSPQLLHPFAWPRSSISSIRFWLSKVTLPSGRVADFEFPVSWASFICMMGNLVVLRSAIDTQVNRSKLGPRFTRGEGTRKKSISRVDSSLSLLLPYHLHTNLARLDRRHSSFLVFFVSSVLCGSSQRCFPSSPSLCVSLRLVLVLAAIPSLSLTSVTLSLYTPMEIQRPPCRNCLEKAKDIVATRIQAPVNGLKVVVGSSLEVIKKKAALSVLISIGCVTVGIITIAIFCIPAQKGSEWCREFLDGSNKSRRDSGYPSCQRLECGDDVCGVPQTSLTSGGHPKRDLARTLYRRRLEGLDDEDKNE
ncbi:hypothetical protein C8J55DRAFT_609072 [Lentinula edodes]|uniref:Uncharacterized protein n=1 Tax=Lentinula lateritia TaxID=40482 RepID=A0A9W8ZUW5_9AGAR|nr:hypothetical protein C8J55DRAFT_609072 [Lentinula edodes]